MLLSVAANGLDEDCATAIVARAEGRGMTWRALRDAPRGVATPNESPTGGDSRRAAVTLLSPMPPHDSARQVTQLELACVRSGRTLDQVAFLARIPLSRLQALIAGAPVTIEERQAVMRVLPDWKPRD